MNFLQFGVERCYESVRPRSEPVPYCAVVIQHVLLGCGFVKGERGFKGATWFYESQIEKQIFIIYTLSHFSVRAKPLFCLLLLSGIPAFVPSAHTLGNTHDWFLYQSSIEALDNKSPV